MTTRPAAVLFDIGDTLVERPTVGPGRRIAAALGLPDDAARTITRLVFREPFASPRALAERLRSELRLAATPEAAVAAIWRAQEEEPIEVGGASACVAAVGRAGARIALVSNIWSPYEIGFRRACPAIPPLVDSWHLSYRAGVAKPDPSLFEAAVTALGVSPRATVMVGDSLEKDVRPALALGMRAVWLTRSTVPADGLVPVGCDVARDFGDVERLLGLRPVGERDPASPRLPRRQ